MARDWVPSLPTIKEPSHQVDRFMILLECSCCGPHQKNKPDYSDLYSPSGAQVLNTQDEAYRLRFEEDYEFIPEVSKECECTCRHQARAEIRAHNPHYSSKRERHCCFFFNISVRIYLNNYTSAIIYLFIYLNKQINK